MAPKPCIDSNVERMLPKDMKASSPGIVVASRPGFFARVQLRSPVFEALCRSDRPVVVLWPRMDDKQLQAELASPNVFVEPLYTRREASYLGGLLEGALQQIRAHSWPRETPSAAMEQRLNRQRRSQRTWKWKTRCLWQMIFIGAWFTSRYAWTRTLLRKLEGRVASTTGYQRLFERYKPGVVITASPGYGLWYEDAYVIRAAQRAGIPTVCVVLSWDNTSSKGLFGATPDYFLAWTEAMKKELVAFHDVDPGRIHIVGTPLFDPYIEAQGLDHKAALMQQFLLDPARKTILIGTKSPNNYAYNAAIVALLVQALRDGRFVKPVQLIIRPHPINFSGEGTHPDVVAMQRLAAHSPHVHLCIPEQSAADVMDPSWSGVDEMVRLIGGSDLVVSMFSTMQVEAALYDKAVVNVAFDPGPVGVDDKSLTEEEQQYHNARVAETGGVQLARSPEHLVECINRYLDDPALDSEGRRVIRRQECGPLDGKAAERIADFILAVADQRF